MASRSRVRHIPPQDAYPSYRALATHLPSSTHRPRPLQPPCEPAPHSPCAPSPALALLHHYHLRCSYHCPLPSKPHSSHPPSHACSAAAHCLSLVMVPSANHRPSCTTCANWSLTVPRTDHVPYGGGGGALHKPGGKKPSSYASWQDHAVLASGAIHVQK